MTNGELNVVIGAFSYTGKFITQRLLSMGESVRTITGHPDRPNPFEGKVDAFPMDFEKPDELTRNMQGAKRLFNTYWVRFPRKGLTYDRAVENSKVLIKAASEAGVERIIHVSVTNASEESELSYFRGKGLVERAVKESGVSYAIIRPAVLFGHSGILINNIAWLLRKFPVFPIPGDGGYRIQPVFVEDMAEIAVDAANMDGNITIDALGPESYTFNELVKLIRGKIGARAWIMHLNPGLMVFLSKIVGFLIRDVMLTRDEVKGLMDNLLISDNPPTGRTRLSEWLEENVDAVGREYAYELKKRY
jgi:NADH dehydrogenase